MCPPTSRYARLSSAGARCAPSLSPRSPPGHFPVHPAPLQLLIGHLEGLGDRILSRLQQYFYLSSLRITRTRKGKPMAEVQSQYQWPALMTQAVAERRAMGEESHPENFPSPWAECQICTVLLHVSARSGSMVSPTRPDRCVEAARAANPRGVRQCSQEWDRR
ncbi:hypothetical protein OIDMADRAFT_26284 [Oidiodendron maius Zn]|uniref:Uncharacterized protein n=1 Tax=Oidiodendron maius (strain Zn) TaxID=913774 RepID=A0A0C3CX96_OIDMZ|nr:hypothetical protein OIDMADRAFT_26284 [Oidiodendron maius Zn]